ncbi:MAG TPA: phosphohydrolase, partial [Anaerolineae bacterium]|nr:phosphohydrolase [Anaerolineae bacterium]
ILADYRALGEAVWDRFNGGRDGTLWYYRALVEELDRTVTELEHLGRAWAVV